MHPTERHFHLQELQAFCQLAGALAAVFLSACNKKMQANQRFALWLQALQASRARVHTCVGARTQAQARAAARPRAIARAITHPHTSEKQRWGNDLQLAGGAENACNPGCNHPATGAHACNACNLESSCSK